MKHWAKIITLISCLCLTLISTASLAKFVVSAPKGSTQSLDQIVAIVNKDIITQSEVDQQSQAIKQQLTLSGMPVPSDRILKQRVLQRLIDIKLQLQIAKRYKLTVKEGRVDQAIAAIAKRNHLTVAQLKQKIAAQGGKLAKYRNEIRKEILLSKVQHMAISKKVTITDAQLKAFTQQYQQKMQKNREYHVLDLLLAPPHTQADAEKVLRQLKAGANIQKISKRYQLTDLGWRAANDLPDIFLKPVQRMAVDSFAGPIKAPNGYHILKLAGNRASTQDMPSSDQLRMMLYQQKFIKALNAWLDTLKETAYVKIIKAQ